MLGRSESALRQGFGPKAQNACTAQKRRGPEGPLGGSLPNVYFMTLILNIGFNRPLRPCFDPLPLYLPRAGHSFGCVLFCFPGLLPEISVKS